MVPMISGAIKPTVTRLINPIAKVLLRIGLTPNAVTVFGACGVIGTSLIAFSQGKYFYGTLFIIFFSLSDLLDGAMARLTDDGASSWGAFLDSTLDRIADAAILFGITIYLVKEDDPLVFITIYCLVSGFLIPYIRAKAESIGISCSVGIAERTERLVLTLAGIGLAGLNVPYALSNALWLLAVLSTVTIFQRIQHVRNAL